MAGNPHNPSPARLNPCYHIAGEQYQVLCQIRNELRLLSAFATRRATHEPAQADHHTKLSRCFGSLARRLDSIVGSMDQAGADTTTDDEFPHGDHSGS